MSTRRGPRGRTTAAPAHPMVRRSASVEAAGSARITRGASANAYGVENGNSIRNGVADPLSPTTLARGLNENATRTISSASMDAIVEEMANNPARMQTNRAIAASGSDASTVSETTSITSTNADPPLFKTEREKKLWYSRQNALAERRQAISPEFDNLSYGNDHENGLLGSSSFSRDTPANPPKPPVIFPPSIHTVTRYFQVREASSLTLVKRTIVALGVLLLCAMAFFYVRWNYIPRVSFVDTIPGPRSAPSEALYAISTSNHQLKILHDGFSSCKRDVKELSERIETLDKHIKEHMEERVQTLDNRVWPQRANFFSPMLGAVVDPQHTSPTLRRSEGIRSRLYHMVFRDPSNSPPIRALTPWTENGDCWCAAQSRDGGGRLSIGIWMRFDIIPTGITIEHPDNNLAIDATSAPRDLELWVRVARKDEHLEINEYLANNEIGCESPRPHTRGNWICLHKWSYNSGILKPYVKGGHIQRSEFRIEPEFSIDKAVVRVMRNWGQDYTCLYQVKMDGIISR